MCFLIAQGGEGMSVYYGRSLQLGEKGGIQQHFRRIQTTIEGDLEANLVVRALHNVESNEHPLSDVTSVEASLKVHPIAS